MATASSTRPPTLGQASSAPEGEEAQEIPIVDVPLADVAAWEGAAPSLPEPQAGLGSAMVPAEEPLPSVVVDAAQLTVPSQAAAPPGTKTPPPETPLPVLLLVDQAHGAEGAERAELARRINRWLEQMAREGGSRHVADWFHHLLESGRLEGLADAEGRSCHEAAVRGLLAMGFPYALEVRPEDLERLPRREEREAVRGQDKYLKAAGAGIVAGGFLAEFVLAPGSEALLPWLLAAEGGAVLLATMALLLSGPRTPLRHVGLAVLLVGSLALISTILLGGYTGLVAGLGGLLAALLFALHRS